MKYTLKTVPNNTKPLNSVWNLFGFFYVLCFPHCCLSFFARFLFFNVLIKGCRSQLSKGKMCYEFRTFEVWSDIWSVGFRNDVWNVEVLIVWWWFQHFKGFGKFWIWYLETLIWVPKIKSLKTFLSFELIKKLKTTRLIVSCVRSVFLDLPSSGTLKAKHLTSKDA